ncbi:hypothetical protein LUZ60_002259 [Juncus effusus]|nr:hypothetical protein LUZ60_002259 [Juncus effusus]
MDPERRRSAGDQMDEETIARRRSRRVSFADTTAVHVFERDESSDTPPKRTSSPFSGGKSTVDGGGGGGGGGEGSDGDDTVGSREVEEDDDDGPPEMFIRDMIDGCSPGSASAASIASNDDENFFGPVSTRFLKLGRFSDSGILEDNDDNNSNHDITMDSTAFSLRFNKVEDTPSSSASHLITPPVSVLSDGAEKTVSNVKSKEGISDFSLIANNSSKYDFGRLSPTLDELLKEVDHGLKPNVLMDQILKLNSDENISTDHILNPNSDENIPTNQILNPNSHENIPTDQILNPNSHENIPTDQILNPNSHRNIPPPSPQIPTQTKTIYNNNNNNNNKNEIILNTPKSPAGKAQSPPGSIQSLRAKRLELFNEAGPPHQSIDSELKKHTQRISAIKDSILKKSPKVKSVLSTHLNFEDNENDDLKSIVRFSPQSARNVSRLENQNQNQNGNNNEIVLRTPKSSAVQLLQVSPNSTRAERLQLLGEAVLSIGSELFLNLDQPISAISDSILVQSPISKAGISPNRLDFENEDLNEGLSEGLWKEFDFEGRKRRIKRDLERESPVKHVRREMSGEMSQDCRVESARVDWRELVSNLKDIMSQIFSPSIQKCTLHEIDLLLAMLERLHMASKFDTLASIMKDCNSTDPRQEKLAEARMLHCKLIYEKAKLELNCLKLAKLQAEADVVSERAREVCSLKSRILERRSLSSGKSSTENDIPKEEQEKLVSKRQAVETIQQKVKNLTFDVQVLYKIPENLSCDETIKIAKEHLEQKKLCLAIQQDLRLWVLHETIKKDNQREIVLNYRNFLFQRFTIGTDKSSNIHVNNTLNKSKIEQTFRNMNAYVAFDFLFRDEKRDLKYIWQETMETGLLLGNLLKILHEIQDAKIEVLNLISTNFEFKLSDTSSKLELQMGFMNFTKAKKLSLSLDLTDLKRPIPPQNLPIVTDKKRLVKIKRSTLLTTEREEELRSSSMAFSVPQLLSLQTLTLLLFLSLSAQAQNSSSGTPSCASNLVPCANYLNSTSPPDTCCSPLKDAITNDLACLCAIYEDPSILKAFGISLSDALKLAQYCGINSTDNQCNATAPSGINAKPPPSPHTGMAGEKMIRIGVSGLVTLLVLWSIWI